MNNLVSPIRLIFLVRSLDAGGAERQLTQLVRGLDKKRFDITVLTFYGGGELWDDVASLSNVKLVSLEKKGRWDLVSFWQRLIQQIKVLQPHVIHAYLGVANELALVSGKVAGSKVVWGLRASNMDFSKYDWLQGATFHIGAFFSRWADLIIVNSSAGQRHYLANRYSKRAMITVSNGINCDKFYPCANLGRQVRNQWGIAQDRVLIGMVARLDPMKDHITFLQAAARLLKQRDDIWFVCVGNGEAGYKQGLMQWVVDLGIGEHVIWAGSRRDITAVYNSFDIAVLASKTEGFPNVVGEAMACGIPCVATDVGDASVIVGSSKQVVPAQDPEALAEAIVWILNLSDDERKQVGENGRLRIIENFSLQTMVSTTEKALEALVI